MGKRVIKSGLVLKPILDVDAIPIALTLKQYFTFALDLVHKVLRGGGGSPLLRANSLGRNYLYFVTWVKAWPKKKFKKEKNHICDGNLVLAIPVRMDRHQSKGWNQLIFLMPFWHKCRTEISPQSLCRHVLEQACQCHRARETRLISSPQSENCWQVHK